MYRRLFSLRGILQSTAALALVAPGLASAQLPGEIYLGLGAGESSYDANIPFDDDKDTGWKAFAGFDVNRIFGVEAGYIDLGTAKLPGNAEADVTGFNIDARVGAPLGPVSVFAKAGGFYSDVEISTPLLGSVDDQSWQLTYGAGAEFDFAKNMAVRAEWERFELDDLGVLRDPEVDLISASFVFKFK